MLEMAPTEGSGGGEENVLEVLERAGAAQQTEKVAFGSTHTHCSIFVCIWQLNDYTKCGIRDFKGKNR